MLFCKDGTSAKNRYQRAVLQFLGCYIVVLFCSAWFMKHNGGEFVHGARFYFYFWSLFPAIPVVGVIIRMGAYLREETDEYEKWQTIQSILVGAGTLLAVTIVSDFLRSFAKVDGLPPFWGFTLFGVAMGATRAWQKFSNRGLADD